MLLRREPGGALVAKVADFGLARADVDTHDPEPRGPDSELIALARNSVLSQGMTRLDAVVGTPLYMSPEQHVAGPIDARSDQFSFCVALFAALYGEHPYDGDTLELLARAASSPRRAAPPVGSRAPKWLHRLCLRGMQPDRAARFPDMGALLAEVDRRRGRVGRVGLAIFGSLAVGIALAIGLAGRGPAIDACGGGPARMQGVWDASVQTAAERTFAATGALYAGDAWTATRAQIDLWQGEWLRMHRDSCEATARGEQSSGRLDLRMQCLERRRQELAALTDLYVHADKQVVRGAFDAALALPAVDGCQDPPAPGAHVDPPPPIGWTRSRPPAVCSRPLARCAPRARRRTPSPAPARPATSPRRSPTRRCTPRSSSRSARPSCSKASTSPRSRPSPTPSVRPSTSATTPACSTACCTS